jgi:hypothetical protein
MTIQVSIDGLRLAAARSGQYVGSETYWCGADGKWVDVWLTSDPPSAAKTLIYKKGGDRPFVGVAKFDSYKQEYEDRRSGAAKLSGQWAKMPDVMIAKCSEALALRKAFPAELAGIDGVTPEEKRPHQDFDVEPITFRQTEVWQKFVSAIAKAETLERVKELVALARQRVNEGKMSPRNAAHEAIDEEFEIACNRVEHKGYSLLPKYLEAVNKVTDPDEADALTQSAFGDLAGDDLQTFQKALGDRLTQINRELDEALAE